MASHIIRSTAYDEARRLQYRTFSTEWDKINCVWRLKYVPGEPAVPEEWANKDFVAWTETRWIGSTEEAPGQKIGVLIVKITKEELEDENIPDNFLVEPITPELWGKGDHSRDVARVGRSSNGASKGERAKSDAVSPVKIVWETADTMKGADRKAIIEACVVKGVNRSTAQTQFYRWSKAQSS